MCLTLDHLREAASKIEGLSAGPTTVRFSTLAVKNEGPNFKPSRSRKPRVYKKLLKRLGYRHVPAIIQMKDPFTGQPLVIAHPAYKERIEAALKEAGFLT